MKYFVFVIGMSFDLFFLTAIVVTFRRTLAAKRWHEGSGRILTSRVEARRVQRVSDDADTRTPTYEFRNFAAVTYLFETPRGVQRGSEISIQGEIIESDVAEVVKRYPKNAKVIVYYDPADPRRCVLERGVIEPAFKTLIWVGAFVAVALCLFVVGSPAGS